MTVAGILWLVGMALVFVGEQIIGDGMARWSVSGIGALLVVASIGLRARRLTSPDRSIKTAVIQSMIMGAVGGASLLTYALATDDVALNLGLDDAGLLRWQGVFSTLTPVLLVIGAVPMLFLDLVLSQNPVMLPRDAARRALVSGLFSALAICLVFPVNYLASHLDDYEVDTSYFKTAEAGEATEAMVSQLTDPITVYLFFPAGNEVLQELEPYFRDLEAAAAPGMLTVEVHDQALSAGLAEQLSLRDNGWVVLEQQTDDETSSRNSSVKFKMREELRRAKRDLKRFDSLFQKNLLKATRGTRLAYTTVGHGEATHRERENDWRKLSKFRAEMKAQSYKFEDLGLAEGLAESVPADADTLIIAAPKEALLPEEVEAITSWLEEGGELMVMVDSQSDGLDGLLGWLGLERIPGPIQDPEKRIRGASPYLVITDRYGTHPATETLSKLRRAIVFPGPVGLRDKDGGHGKKTVLVRTYGTAFADVNSSGKLDEGEQKQVHNLAYAIEGGEGDTAWRAVVIGNQAFVSDQAFSQGWLTGPLLTVDSMRWLAGEEETVGETESEEDVKIDHSPGGSAWWFWGTIFAVPLLVLGGGTARFMIRRRMS